MDTIEVKYQGARVGALSYDKGDTAARFEYAPDFVDKGIALSPLKMPAEKGRIYTFPGLNWDTFKGLPGMLADSLPDNFGNAVLQQWLATQKQRTTPLTPLERLQYTGSSGMGALEYYPAQSQRNIATDYKIELEKLTFIAQRVLDERNKLNIDTSFASGTEDKVAMQALLAVGTSAGGARAKAVLAFNDDFTNVRSEQGNVPDDYRHYLLKFDGVTERDPNQQTFADPLGYGVAEYVYYLLAQAAGIRMMPCQLLNEGNRRHFITQRFDRLENNQKRHIQTLTAIAHVNYHQPRAFSYEQLFQVARELRLPKEDALQLFTQMVFNHVARNNDDHSKNFAFMLDQTNWRITPAYDLAFCYKANNDWVSEHWMTLNGKTENHTRADFYALANVCLPRVPKTEIDAIIDRVIEAVSMWDKLAKENDVPEPLRRYISSHLYLTRFI